LPAAASSSKNWAQVVDLAKYMSTPLFVRKELRQKFGALHRDHDLANAMGIPALAARAGCYDQFIYDVLCSSRRSSCRDREFAPLKQRLRVRYEAEGGKRKSIITGHFKGELDPVEYESPEMANITPKNSPLGKPIRTSSFSIWQASVGQAVLPRTSSRHS